MKYILIILLSTYLQAQQCWLHLEGEYISFFWMMEATQNANAVDNELNKLFIFEAINSKSYICERIK